MRVCCSEWRMRTWCGHGFSDQARMDMFKTDKTGTRPRPDQTDQEEELEERVAQAAITRKLFCLFCGASVPNNADDSLSLSMPFWVKKNAKGSSKGKGRYWQDDDCQSDFNFKFRRGGKGGGLGASVDKLSDVILAREARELAKEERQDRLNCEKEERGRKEKEAADRKKEREEFQEEMRKDRQKLVAKLDKAAPSTKKKKSKEDSDTEEELGTTRRRPGRARRSRRLRRR